MQIAVNQLIVPVADMDRSVAFYRDLLGLEPLTVSEHWSEFHAGALTIALHPGRANAQATFESGTDAGTLTIGLTTPDLEETCVTLRKRGVVVDGLRDLEGLPPIATFSDPDGASFSLSGVS
jgi:catechol 2,3-dioxygenase-like lactoylglutathione lyase family enzyme